jgi:hypothetical protein
MRVAPGVHRLGKELGAVVDCDLLGKFTAGANTFEDLGNLPTGEVPVGVERQVSATPPDLMRIATMDARPACALTSIPLSSETMMKLAAAMVTCPEREEVRRQTLANLRATDWEGEVALFIDDGAATWRRALAFAGGSDADFVLLMEDDLDFNRHLRANLTVWSRITAVDPTLPFFASLYNPGHRPVHSHAEERYLVMDPGGCWGAQALVVSPVLARYFLAHWDEVQAEPDIRMPHLAGRLGPIYYHRPSLVQHIGHVSTWGGRVHQAAEFDRDWHGPQLRQRVAVK